MKMEAHSANDPSYDYFMKLTPSQIRKMDRDAVVGKLGLGDTLTQEERDKCIWQLETLYERLALLNEQRQNFKALKNSEAKQASLKQDLDKSRAKEESMKQAIAAHMTIIGQRDETIHNRDTAIGGYVATIAQRDQTIEAQNRIIAKRQSEDSCWKCYFLQKSRGVELSFAIVFTIIVNMIIASVAAVDTVVQQSAKENAQIGIGVIGGIAFVLLCVWIIGRCCKLEHSTHS